jgi:hypothetical protein
MPTARAHLLELPHTVPSVFCLLALLASLASGCGLGEERGASAGPSEQLQPLEDTNGLSVNGLILNGLSVNGLTLNGLSVNGLSHSDFHTWFQSSPALSESVMRYLVLCAAPSGQTLSYTDSSTGQEYTWSGELGLATGWAAGQEATVAEQQVVSACLAAHVNKFGMHISISLLGLDGAGQPLAYSAEELSSHSRKEACIFGNLFSGEGLFVGNDGGALNSSESSARVCTLTDEPGTARVAECAPLVQVGPCATHCTLDESGTYYTSCTYQGATYQPLTTRLRAEDVYQCGDGICQVTESCGTSNQYNNCQLDCGSCP